MTVQGEAVNTAWAAFRADLLRHWTDQSSAAWWSPLPYLKGIEVQFPPDQQDKLSRMAEGRAAEALVREAGERLLNYDEWFLREVDKGLAAAERREFVEHEDVGKMIERRFPA